MINVIGSNMSLDFQNLKISSTQTNIDKTSDE